MSQHGCIQIHLGAMEVKQFDMMRFLLRVCPGNTSGSLFLTGLPAPPDQIKCIGWDIRPNKVMSYTGFVSRWWLQMPSSKGATYGKPLHHSVTQLRFAGSYQSVAEERAGAGHLESPETGFVKIPYINSCR